MMNLRIAMLTESFPPIIDGVSATADNYAACIHAGGGAVTAVVPAIPGGFEAEYPVIEYPALGMVAEGEYPLGFPYLPRTMRACREFKPDIIHAHSPFLSMSLALKLRRKLNKPVILSLHSKYTYDLERFARFKPVRNTAESMMIKHINAADEIWVSSMSAAHYLKDLGYSGGHYCVPKGTDFKVKEPDSEMVAELRTRYNIPYNIPVLLYVGRLIWYKNIRNIIDAADALRERKQPFRVLIVGDGPDRTAMEDYTANRKLDGLVHFVGRITDRSLLQSFYNLADLMVFPSMYDNGPQVMVEAAACSLPAIAARGGAAAELIEEGVSGFVCNPEAGHLADGIEEALSDRRMLRRAGAAARQHIYRSREQVADCVTRRYEMVSKLYKARCTELDYIRSHSKKLNMPPKKLKSLD